MTKQNLEDQNKIMIEALSNIANFSINDVPETYDKYAYLCGYIQAEAKNALEKVAQKVSQRN